MKLRRAISLSKQRLTRKAFRAALSLGAASCLFSATQAQQLPALPDFPTQSSSPAAPELPLPAFDGQATSDTKQVSQARLVRFVGLKQDQALRTAGLPSTGRPAETSCSSEADCKTQAQPSETPARRVATTPGHNQPAKITWQPRSTGTWKANPYVQTTQHETSAVVPAAATTKVETGISDGGSREITMTISGNGDTSDSLLDVDIPLTLPTMPAAPPQAAGEQVTKQIPRSGSVRRPEPVSSSTRMRLSDSKSAPKTQSRAIAPKPSTPEPITPEHLGVSLPASPAGLSSGVGAAKLKEESAPETFNLSDRRSARSEKPTTKRPTLPKLSAAKSTAMVQAPKIQAPKVQDPKLRAPKLPTLDPVPPKSTMEAIKLTDRSLPSTKSSRGQGVKKPMQVRIEGVPSKPTASKPSLPTLGTPPKPAMPSTRMSLSDQPKPSLKRIPASLASQRKPMPPASSAASDALTRTSSRRSASSDSSGSADLSVVVAQAVPLSVRSTIVQTSVEDPSVCQLIQSGERNLSLVGLKQGSTRVAIVTTDGSQEPQVRVYQVAVGRGDKAEYGLTELAEGIDQTIARLYPSSNIRVRTGDGKLVVSGTAGSEDEARRVLSLVRRTSLMPVVDQLETR